MTPSVVEFFPAPPNVIVRRDGANIVKLRVRTGAATSEVAIFLAMEDGTNQQLGRKSAAPFSIVEFDVEAGLAPLRDELIRCRAYGSTGELSDPGLNFAVIENTKPESPFFVE